MAYPQIWRHSAMMFLCIINFDILRNLKESLLVTRLGAEAIPFVKLWVIMPAAFIFLISYSFLANRLNKRELFVTSLLPFLLWMPLFTQLLYPSLHALAPASACLVIEQLLPENLKLIAGLIYYWPLTLFFAVAELWSAAVLCILFWTTVNDVNNTDSATRSYPLITLIGNSASIISGPVILFCVRWNEANHGGWQGSLWVLTVVFLVCGIGIITLHGKSLNHVPWQNKQPEAPSTATSLSLHNSFSYLIRSRYLGCIAVIMVAYGVAINMVELAWKSQLARLHTTEAGYSMFMGKLTLYNGVGCLLFALAAPVLLKKSWKAAAMTPPVLMIATAVPFFLLVFQSEQSLTLAGTTVSLLSASVVTGMLNNVVSKSGKYTLFDATKEIAFIPLDDEQKLKGKAAIELVASRLGKSSSAAIQQMLILLSGSLTLAMPWLAGIFMVVAVLWLITLNTLGKQYNRLTRSPSD